MAGWRHYGHWRATNGAVGGGISFFSRMFSGKACILSLVLFSNPHRSLRMAKAKKTVSTKTGAKIAKAVSASWKRMTPKARAARIKKMHAWRKKK